MRVLIALFLFLITYTSYSQDPKLMDIVNSTAPLDFRQQQIDSLIHQKKIAPKNEALAEFYHDLGSKWYYINWWESGNENEIQEALFYTDLAYDIKKKLPELSTGSLEKTMFNMGFFNFLRGKVFVAQDYYQQLIETGKDQRLVQKTKTYLGMLYLKMGDFYKALETFDNIISNYQDISGNETMLIEIYIEIANTYAGMGIKEHSLKIKNHLLKADSLLQKSGIIHLYLTDDINHTEGDRLLAIGRYKKAITYHQKVLNDSINLYDYDINLVLNSLAQSHIKLKQYSKAELLLKNAIKYNPDNSNTYENLGDLQQAQKNYKNALVNYQKAIVWASNKNNPVIFKELPQLETLELSTNKLFLLNHLVAKANCWLAYYKYENKAGYLNHSLATFSLADKLVDIIRSESTENKSKLFWREKGAQLYTKAVEVCFLLDKPQEAFYFMERNKALLLLEDVTSEHAKEITQLPKSITQREYELRQAIFLAENKLENASTKNADSLQILKTQIYEHKNQFLNFTDSVGTAFPEYAKLKNKATILSYADFKNKYATKDEAVLQYILNDEQGYGLLSTAEKTHFFKLDDIKELNNNLVALYGQLIEISSTRSKMKQYAELSHSVFQKLMPSAVFKAIRNKKLTIVSDYILQQIPFESFVINKDEVKYLIEDVEIRYAYSMSYLDAKKTVQHSPKKELLGFAPIHFTALGLPELSFSGEELSAIEKIFHGQIAEEREATKSLLLTNLNDYKIVHLSTHADVGENGAPWIAFSDTKLFLNEIYANKNQADMVVLSGCNTSIGELKKGEGAMSLARGFFHSGAKSVVSSLWTISDKTSKDLMTSFYKALDQGMTKSAALRKAKIDYINKYRGTAISPSFWAALIIIGDNSPIATSSWTKNNWGLLLGLSLFLIFILGFTYYRKNKNYSNS